MIRTVLAGFVLAALSLIPPRLSLPPTCLNAEFASQAPLLADDYISYGLACCFAMDDNNKPQPTYVIEPLTAGTLETIFKGVPTSYKRVVGLSCGTSLIGDPADPDGVAVAWRRVYPFRPSFSNQFPLTPRRAPPHPEQRPRRFYPAL